MILNRQQILQRRSMITPFLETQGREVNGVAVASFGLGYYGYDARLGEDFIVYQHGDVQVSEHKSYLILQPGEWCLGVTIETFDMPNNVFAIVQGKSSYARQGILINCCPIEPGWKGQYTMAIHNIGTKIVALESGGGIAQVIFFEGETPDILYDGKYQGSMGVTPSR